MAAEFRGIWGKLGLRLVVVSGLTELILGNHFAKLVRLSVMKQFDLYMFSVGECLKCIKVIRKSSNMHS